MLEIVPMTLREANAFVEQNHRHHGPVAGHKFSIGISDGEKIVGVAIVGRPVSRHLDDGWTLEVNRLCTDGSRNTCSMLYAAAWRAARAMGYKRLVTYILESESGASLRAAVPVRARPKSSARTRAAVPVRAWRRSTVPLRRLPMRPSRYPSCASGRYR